MSIKHPKTFIQRITQDNSRICQPTTEADKAYLAGIIDGEGSIMAMHHNPNLKIGQHHEYWTIRISVGNTDIRLIEWLLDRFGGNHYTRSISPKVGWKPSHIWSLDSRRAISIIETVMPFLVLKKRQAEIALEMISLRWERKGKPRTTRVSEEILERRRTLVAELKELNRRGVSAV